MEDFKALEKKAIDLALDQKWHEAIEVNEKILKLDPKNLDAHLRIGFALLQTNNPIEAKKYYQKALKIQPNHPAAIQNLSRIKILLNQSIKKNSKKTINLDPNLFLEIPGKTKTVQLVNLGQKSTLANLTIGERLKINIRKRKIEIRTENNQFVGHLPDDLSKRLQILIKAGSEFSCFIKEASLNRVIIFLKEEKRGQKVKKFYPFPITEKVDLLSTNSFQENQTEEDQEEFNLTEDELEKLAESLLEENEKLESYLPFSNVDEDEESE